jgi:hypothetical protein
MACNHNSPNERINMSKQTTPHEYLDATLELIERAYATGKPSDSALRALYINEGTTT